MMTTNLEIKIEVVTEEDGTFEKTCQSIDEAVNYLEGMRKMEIPHSVSF